MASRSFRRFVEQELGSFPHFLIYAILEWVMIVLLFIDGFLAFTSNEFAKLFELQIPCLLCTRIDHVLVHRNPDFYYNDSICEHHKKDISSLAYCHVHRKLSNILSMCEGCLLSFATERDSKCDTNKSLDCSLEGDKRVYLKSAEKDDLVQVERCSCCGETMKMRTSSKSYGRNLSMNYGASPRAPRVVWRNEEGRNLELSPLRFMADNELEIAEDEIGLNAVNRQSKEAATLPLLAESEDISEDACKTPSFSRGHRFFGIPLSDSASASPRWSSSKLARKLQLEKLDVLPVSNDESATNEADGDSIVHRLKRQVGLDRKSLIALYVELDEERSASAVAANNAMAMITRLQAEKAYVQMEASQYQRMMEEQAEYDQEAFQVLKDTLIKRNDEVKVLEANLEAYREKYGHLNRVGSEECEADPDEDYQELKSHSFSSFGEISNCESPPEVNRNGVNESKSERVGENGDGVLDESSLGFESERSYFMGILANLEKKIKSSSDEKTHSSKSKSDMVKLEDEDRGLAGHENKAILKGELSLIRERLRSIEEDSALLKHAAMTLQKGCQGTLLLTEIAQHLRKLRHSEKAEDTVA